MSATIETKVYYLPAAEPVREAPLAPRSTSLRRRLARGWARLRMALAVAGIGRRRRRRNDYAALLEGVIGDSPAVLIDRRPRKPSRPATILDFEAARVRLRRTTA